VEEEEDMANLTITEFPHGVPLSEVDVVKGMDITKRISILWLPGIEPFMLKKEEWHMVDDPSNVVVYEWHDDGRCCVAHKPYKTKDKSVRTDWKIVSRGERRGRSKVGRFLFSCFV
jgi:hypothetical protein